MSVAAQTTARGNGGRFIVTRPALERFAEKCQFDARTGCVLWIGGKTCGGGKVLQYGSFKDGGRRWSAHRWAAKHIHGLDIEEYEVDHCCPLPIPNTLCVQHLQAVTKLRNLELMWGRRVWGWDDWDQSEPSEPDHEALPFHLPPSWLVPFTPGGSSDCPF
jgi:hypothetical protein